MSSLVIPLFAGIWNVEGGLPIGSPMKTMGTGQSSPDFRDWGEQGDNGLSGALLPNDSPVWPVFAVPAPSTDNPHCVIQGVPSGFKTHGTATIHASPAGILT